MSKAITSSSTSTSSFFTPHKIYPLALLLRLVLLLYGTYQDSHSPLKYTDIDYLVFTDAARFVAEGSSPYERATYRYTPLLSWALLPTTYGAVWFSFGKVLFALSDIVAGWLLARMLRGYYGMNESRALRYASVWLLNPMVANISTRGSSEGVLGLISCLLVYLVLGVDAADAAAASSPQAKRGGQGKGQTQRLTQVVAAGIVLGVGVHVKIYPFVYGVSVLVFLDRQHAHAHKTQAGEAKNQQQQQQQQQHKQQFIYQLLTPARLLFTLAALLTFATLNALMYHQYGWEFLHHTFLHHLTRVDHRHNFSVYASLLYDSAAASASSFPGNAQAAGIIPSIERWAFLPQLGLALVAIPLTLARKSLPGAMLAQTFAFVAWNKVCTSQYFLWYLIFLPLYLPDSSFRQNPRLGVGALVAWVVAQALWLQQAYNLEFLALSTFVPGLFVASVGFFAVNVWILGVIIQDIGSLDW
ncbi:glycosylphosphatidylinositol-alpha 1,4 mannosyltransferase I [Aspergillus saccharolyticus JOP 1030-1]|uniref:GPI mannosyltransferase 1 n=1 Tax=Aspergillus saccharolyticus JOP 1030-1 TaxID=1450539 RepID=A0A318ZBC8_9EURO|nr:hypothetical protein BP01DRAFT_358372 [Aspergillus saccharolyticus JOP 1030-1]PYH43644.1 hypothetical protein BP01DRAFT_358372 [Aspergillus saccharolyticus JOP 1030-1]